MAETELIHESLDPNKATGHDQIPARVLQDGASVLAGPIARLINTVTDNACVPAEWKLAQPFSRETVDWTTLTSLEDCAAASWRSAMFYLLSTSSLLGVEVSRVHSTGTSLNRLSTTI